MATQPLSELSEPPRPKMAASIDPLRPQLVGVDSPIGRVDLRDEPSRSNSSWDTVQLFGVPDLAVLEPGVAFVKLRPEFAPARRRRSFRDSAKRAFDIVGAIALGLIFAPLMLALMLFLHNDGGPLIYRHRRIGRDGKSFECLKFRSMIPDADRKLREVLEQRPELKAEWLRDHKLRNDPRITAVGRFLRRTSFDELPQIWNVLRGDMSLVGPRPIVREEMMRYGRCLPIYLSAKPGITGLWQVTGRNDTDYRRRVVLDVYYVRKQSALLDLYILLKTTGVILRGGGAY